MSKHTIKPTLGLAVTCGLALAALATCATLASAATTEQKRVPKSKAWQDIGASERVDFAGRVHTYAQRIAASSCNLEAGIETEVSRGLLAASARELERILDGLRYGNGQMKIIGEETDPRVLAAYDEIQNQWGPVSATITAILDGSSSPADFELIADWAQPFHQASDIFVSEVTAEYSDPADLLQYDAILLDLAGRQRTRTQMLLSQSCAIWKDGASAAEQAALQETVERFERTHAALRFGAEEVGIKGAPTDQIAAQLERVSEEWAAAQATIATVAQGRSLPRSEVSNLYLQLNEMLIRSTDLVTLYSQYAKHSF